MKRSLSALGLLVLLPALAHAQFRVKPGTIVAQDSFNQAYTLVQYDSAGNVLDSLPVIDPIDIGTMSGVEVLGPDIYVVGTRRKVARVDLDSGLLVDSFPAGTGTGAEALGSLGKYLLVGDYVDNKVSTYAPDGTLIDEVDLGRTHLGVTGVDSDGTHLFVGSYTNGDIWQFTMTGELVSRLSTGIGASRVSDLSHDPGSDTLWVSTGFGDDELRQYGRDGSLLQVFGAGYSFVDGLAIGAEELLLDSSAGEAFPHDFVTLTSWPGGPGDPLALLLWAVDGSPSPQIVLLDRFGKDEAWRETFCVPPGLGGVTVTFRTLACSNPQAHRGLIVSNERDIVLR